MDYAITAREDDELWQALLHNYGNSARLALYDIDELRWVAFRRAVRAGFYTDALGAQPAPR